MPCIQKTDPRLLREDHFLCFVVDMLLAAHRGAKALLERRRTMRELASLSDEQLRDVGLTRGPDEFRRRPALM